MKQGKMGAAHTHTKTWLVCLIKNHFVLNVYHYTHQIGRRLKVLYGSPVVYILHSTDYCRKRERASQVESYYDSHEFTRHRRS